MKYAIHLDAGHDRNGNPRRAFLVYKADGELIDRLDEGYNGVRVLREKHKGVLILSDVPTTPAFYRQVIK